MVIGYKAACSLNGYSKSGLGVMVKLMKHCPLLCHRYSFYIYFFCVYLLISFWMLVGTSFQFAYKINNIFMFRSYDRCTGNASFAYFVLIALIVLNTFSFFINIHYVSSMAICSGISWNRWIALSVLVNITVAGAWC